MTAPSVISSNPIRDVCDYDLLFDCVHCGLCAEACPTYIVTRSEMDSPRGRIYLMKSLAEGRIELDDDAARHLDLCLGCRGCETACPSGVHYGRLIEGARSFVERNHRRGLINRFKRRAVGAIFPYPNRLRILLAPLMLADHLGLRAALRAIAPRMMRDWLDLLPLPDADSRPLAVETSVAPRADAPTITVHHGCVAQVLANSENLNSERLLAAAGYRVVRLATTACCGALDLHSGGAERAHDFARANVQALKNANADAILSAASGCSVAIAEYGELLKDEPEYAADARAVSSRVRDLSSLLLDAPENPKRELRCRVTYHDACHLAHGLGVREAPRKLIASIPGVTLVELPESDLCCGSAGSYNLTEPAMARDLARRKADNIVATGADCVVLANPGCEFQIAAELRRRKSKIKVVHLADFLAMASQ
jgi:glycolate oxidase iron-sulfur subunit